MKKIIACSVLGNVVKDGPTGYSTEIPVSSAMVLGISPSVTGISEIRISSNLCPDFFASKRG
jgi:hypothetical protein